MLELNFDPFPNLQTERLVLRKISVDDASVLFELRTNPDAMKYIGRPPLKSIDEVLELIEKMSDITQRIQWAVTLKSDDKLIGTIGFHLIEKAHYRAEIGYMLHPNYWRKGLMSEAITSVVEYGFEQMGLHSIEARIDPANNQSAKILDRNNFIKEGHLKESFFYNNKFFDSGIYSLRKNSL